MFDIRFFYLFYDYKKIMMLRFKYLYDNWQLNKLNQEYIDEFIVIEFKVKIFVNVVIKYNLIRDMSIFESL